MIRGYLLGGCLLSVVTLTMASHEGSDFAKAAGGIPTTERLDLRQVSFLVTAQPEFQDRLYTRAIKQLREANISWPESDPATEKSATLKLMLKPEPLEALCPGKVLYAPSFMLIEEVIVERTAEVIKDSTWSSTKAIHVREPLTSEEIENDLDGFISRFIDNFRMGNPTVSPGTKRLQKNRSSEKAAPTRSMGGDVSSGIRNVSLKGLKLEAVNFLLSAGASYKPLYSRAMELASKEGIKLAFRPNAKTPATLTLTLDSRPLDEVCPGKVLYEASLELVEEVKIRRNSSVYLWTTTWSRRNVQVTEPVSTNKLEADMNGLLGQFIASYKLDVAKK